MMPEENGYEVLKKIKHFPEYLPFKNTPVIMLTAYSEDHPERQAMLEMGLSLFLKKPFGKHELTNVIENTLVTNSIHLKEKEQTAERLREAQKVLHENLHLRSRLAEETALQAIIGTSEPIQRTLGRIQKVAKTEASVLITGESGTGKELAARAVHGCSMRCSSAFVPVDCVALPANLLESELFGHEKGAFTGANTAQKGLFEVADKGTFFLDEIGELSPDLQAKLLRVLQERQFRRLGGKKLIDVDIRVVAATNRDPITAVEQGLLREDLYYRLNVVPIHLPPLRERPDDIPLLIHHFLKKFNKASQVQIKGVQPEAMDVLMNYKWPGNIRELQNIVERMISLAYSDLLTLEDLPVQINKQSPRVNIESRQTTYTHLPLREARADWLEKFEKKYLIDLIDDCDGNISHVARKAGVNRMTIYRMIKKYQITMKLRVET